MADIFFFSPKATKKILSQEKKITHPRYKNVSSVNKVSHPTETPLYLWYDVFMPPPFTILQVTTKNSTLKVSKIWTIISNAVSVLREHFKVVLPPFLVVGF